MRIQLRVLQFALVLLLLAGCKVGPDFFRPKVSHLSDSYQEEQVAEPSHPCDLAQWWTYFDDPTLDELIALARSQNLDLCEAYHRVAEARSLRRVIRGDLFPQLDGTGAFSHRQTSANANQFVPQTNLTDPFDIYSLGFDTAWEIDLFGQIRRSVEAATGELLAEQDFYRDVLVTLTADVASNYIDVRVLQRRLQIARANLAKQRETEQLVKRRRAAGLVSPLDVAQAESNVHLTAAAIPPLEEQLQLAINRIAVLVGRPPAEWVRNLLDEGPIPNVPGRIVSGAPADLLRRRPDIRRAEHELAAVCARIGIATAELYPKFTINGTISVDSRSASTLFTNDSLMFNVGPSFRWNLFSFGRVLNGIEVERARFQQACAAYQQTVLLGIEEVESGLVGYHREQERVAQLGLAVGATRRAAELSRIQYESGLVAFQSVLDSERQQLLTEDEQATSQGTVLLNLVRTYKALGGGWQCDCEGHVPVFVASNIPGESGHPAPMEELIALPPVELPSSPAIGD